MDAAEVWTSRKLGLGHWITGPDGRQIAVAYGTGTNPKSDDDRRVILAAPQALAALRAVDDLLTRCNPEMIGADQEPATDAEWDRVHIVVRFALACAGGNP